MVGGPGWEYACGAQSGVNWIGTDAVYGLGHAEKVVAKDDWRKRSPEFNEPDLSRNLALAERLRIVGGHLGFTPAEVAIAWTLRNPAVTGAIVGTRSTKQTEGVMGATELQLTDEDVAEIEGTSR
jgi:aryl-alcohol dehydrogenase-like predicted oxidoreductase